MSYRSPYPLRGRKLRRNAPDAEQSLWMRLRRHQIHGVKFRRQEPIAHYVVDFCCLTLKLVIEVDGGQHGEQMEADARRTEFLERLGYRVLRFWNHEVLADTDVVVEQIAREVRRSLASGHRAKTKD